MEGVTVVEKSEMTTDGLLFNGGSELPESNSSFSRSRTKVPKWQIGILIALKASGTFAIFLLGDIMAKSLDPSLPLTANTHYFIPSGMLWRFSQFLQLVTFIQFRYLSSQIINQNKCNNKFNISTQGWRY